MDLDTAVEALRVVYWDDLLNAPDGKKFAIMIDGEPAIARKVHSVDKEDSDYDRDLEVIVEIEGQFFRKTGWANVGSHCYGEYTPSWNDLTEVFPKTKTIITYEAE